MTKLKDRVKIKINLKYILFFYLSVCLLRKSLYKTLAIIMAIQIFGYFFSCISYKIVGQISLTEIQSHIINAFINCLSSLSSTIEVPVLFVVR